MVGRAVALAVLATAVLMSAGCATKRYPNSLEKNVLVRTRTESGFLSKVRADVDVFRVDPDCQVEYLGTMKLDKPSIPVGLANEPAYLVFGFASSSWLMNSSSTISYETLLTPRADYDYEIGVSYVDNMYQVVVQETHRLTGARRYIDRRLLAACAPTN